MTPIIHNGNPVSLDHLAPTSFACPCEGIGRDLEIGVSFRNHCYTEKFDPLAHSKDQIVLFDGFQRPRVFCPIRHGLSFQLPDKIRELPGQKVFQTAERRNFVYAVTLQMTNQLYEIFFMLQRAEKAEGMDLRLTVESAYPVNAQSPLPKRPQAIRFGILALKTFRRQEVRFAAR